MRFEFAARSLALAALLGAAAACASPGEYAAERNDLVARGRAIAEANCARCHGIGRSDESPLDEAPPFRRLSERYPIDSLAEAFAEGIVVGHKEMPAFEFSPPEIDALLAYLKSLRS